MGNRGGMLLIVVEPARAEMLESLVEERGGFTDVVSVLDFQPQRIALCLVSLDGENIRYAVLVRKGQRVATGKCRIQLSNFVALEGLSFRQIEAEIGGRYRHHFSRLVRGMGGRVPPATWGRLISTIKRLRPRSANEVESLESLARQPVEHPTGAGFEIVAEEKDALGVALDVFRAERRRLLQSWMPPVEGGPAPFLKGLSQVALREDAMVTQDCQVVPGWDRIGPHVVGAVEFARGDERLTVFNANRASVEEALGVDLVYYHHRYHSFVLVQYKRMTDEDDTGTAGFRPAGKAYEDEVKRIRDFIANHPDPGNTSGHPEYRLHPGGFYFKLCPKVVFSPLSADLLKGMYLPFDYLELVTRAEEARGPRGGLRITYENVGRHIDNTLFIQLLQSGWIGSRGSVSDAITLIVRSVLAGKSVIAAISESVAGHHP